MIYEACENGEKLFLSGYYLLIYVVFAHTDDGLLSVFPARMPNIG